jgi:hypothetical protein
MNDLNERLRLAGSDDERALFARAAAEEVTVPDELRRQVRVALEARLDRRRWPWLALSLLATVLAGSALALTRLNRPLPHETPPLPPHAPVIAALPSPPPAPVPAVPAIPRRPSPPSRAVASSLPPPLDPFRGLAPDDDALPSPSAPRLVIGRSGQPDVAVVLAGGRVVGNVRGSPVALALDGNRLTGKLGGHNVWLWLHGHQAEGELGGISVRFELVDTTDGYLLREGFSVRTALPPSANRISLTTRGLSWFPTCATPLPSVGPGIYEGACAAGHTRIVMAPAWSTLPPLTQAVLLSFFLTERDPAFGALFGR